MNLKFLECTCEICARSHYLTLRRILRCPDEVFLEGHARKVMEAVEVGDNLLQSLRDIVTNINDLVTIDEDPDFTSKKE